MRRSSEEAEISDGVIFLNHIGKLCMNTLFHKATAKHDPLNRSFYQYARKTSHCLPEAVKVLIESGGVPRGVDLRGAYANRCVDSAKLISDHLSQDLVSHEVSFIPMPHGYSEESQQLFMKMITSDLKKTSVKCKEGRQSSCAALKAFNSRLLDYDNRYKNHQWRKTAAGRKQTLIDKICLEVSREASLQKSIGEEREKGRISGFVNAARLKRWGDEVFEHRRKANQFKRKWIETYKVKFRDRDCLR